MFQKYCPHQQALSFVHHYIILTSACVPTASDIKRFPQLFDKQEVQDSSSPSK